MNVYRPASGTAFNMVTALVDRHVDEGRGERPAVRTVGGATLTYRGLQSLVNRAGNAFAAAGLRPEQRVALLLPDGEDFFASFLGAMKIGAVPVPLNTASPPDDLRYFLTNSRASLIVSTPELAAPLRAELAGPGAPSVLVTGAGGSYAAALAAAAPELGAFPTGVDEPSYWLYSSGTTGRPRAAVHLHGDMPACVVPYAEEVVGITGADVTFSVPRLFFSYGLVNSLYLPLLAGASTVLTAERPDTTQVLRVLREMRPTLFFSVPTAYAQLCAALEGHPEHADAFTSPRLAISAGEALPAPLYERWKSLTGIELLDGLGSTEVGYIFCSARPGGVRPGSSGRPLGAHEMKLVDENGADVSAIDTPGELWVHAASTALSYWNDRERTKRAFVGEWIRTGDRYTRDVDGYYWSQGRVGDAFKVSGQWVSPLEIESCLVEHPAVLESAVVGEADAAGLMKAVAYVVLKPDAVVAAEELQLHVKTRLLPHKYPRRIEFVSALPKTSTGKIQRYRFREAQEIGTRSD